jgi:hypothetical protein
MILLILSVITHPLEMTFSYSSNKFNFLSSIIFVVKSIFWQSLSVKNPPVYFVADYHGLALTKKRLLFIAITALLNVSK